MQLSDLLQLLEHISSGRFVRRSDLTDQMMRTAYRMYDCVECAGIPGDQWRAIRISEFGRELLTALRAANDTETLRRERDDARAAVRVAADFVADVYGNGPCESCPRYDDECPEGTDSSTEECNAVWINYAYRTTGGTPPADA